MKFAVVTGSSGGIGQSVCKVLAVRASGTRIGKRRHRSLPRAHVRPPRLSFAAPPAAFAG